ncbi:MAG: hypothetical protein ACYTG0_07520 [Planctomycetota bacterium]|jgi:hypothetical protein
MSDVFDPYHVWLGIPPKDQPPNHYRLLGIPSFESDPKVIESAADRQMAHVRTFQTGPRSDLSQRLLNEIAAARIVLLNLEKKAEYDAGFHAQTPASSVVTPPPPPGGHQRPPAPPRGDTTSQAGASNEPAVGVPRVASRPLRRRQSRPAWKNPVVLGVVASILAALVTLIALVLSAGPPAEVSTGDDRKPATQPERKPPAPKPPAPAPKEKVGPTPPEDKPAAKVPPPEPPAPPDPPAPPIKEVPETPKDPPTPPEYPAPTPKLPDEPPETAEKLPVPDEAVQKRVEGEIREVFAAEYDQATQPAGKLALASKLLSQADDTEEDPAARYVLLSQARRLAVEVGATEIALDAVDRLAEQFDVDPWALRTEAVSRLTGAIRTRPGRLELASRVYDLINPALADDRYNEADKLAKAGENLARRALDPGLKSRLLERQGRVRVLKRAWEGLRPTRGVLSDQPDDPDANLAVGKFYCFTKRDWAHGLPHLIKGSDPTLKEMAEADLAGPDDPIEQHALGDRWWNLADSRPEGEMESARWRAGDWYLAAKPHLSALQKARIEAKLKQSGRVTDLLSEIDPKKVAFSGIWPFDGKILISPPDQFARLQLDYFPPEEYELTIVAERMANYQPGGGVAGHGALVLGLSQGNTQFIAAIDWHEWGRGGFAILAAFNGKVGVNNPLRTFLTEVMIRSGQPNTISFTVKKTGVTATCNNQTLIDWSGDLDQLSVPKEWAVPDRRRLFLGSQVCLFRITRLEVTVLTE